MWRILQHDKPDDFVIATGQYYTVRLFVELAFKEVGKEIVLVFASFVLLFFETVIFQLARRRSR